MAFALTSEQEAASSRFMEFLVDPQQQGLIIDGGPGVGKTTLTAHLYSMAKDNAAVIQLLTQDTTPLSILPVSTTHKACSVLEQELPKGAGKVNTLHSTLQLSLYDNYKTGKTEVQYSSGFKLTKNTLLLVDEYSPVCGELLKYVRSSCHNCKILFIGDHGQLLSHNQTKSAVYASDIPKFNLTNPVRFNGAPGIKNLVYQLRDIVNTGKFTDIVPNGVDVLHVSGSEFQKLIDQDFALRAPHNDSIKIVCWSNNMVNQYNNYVQTMRTGRDYVLEGDTLVSNKNYATAGLNIRNDQYVKVTSVSAPYDLHDVLGNSVTFSGSNKQIFLPKDLTQATSVMREAYKNADYNKYFFIKNNFGDFRPPFAQTVHKSQGSTFKRVYIDLNDIGSCNSPYDVSRMLYVAASRASQQVIFYGELPKKFRGGAWFPV